MSVAWARTPLETNTIAGQRVAGFPLDHPDSLDINTEEDWWQAERHIAWLAERNS